MSSQNLTWRILGYQSIGFIFLIIICWLDEVADLPALLFGAAPSSPNIVEAVEETVIIIILATFVLTATYRLLKRIKLLEGIIPTCSFCKKIREEEEWEHMEKFFSKRSDLQFSHSFCPTCMEKHYNISDKDRSAK